jgi:esterase/lipase superfamily enzyme
LYNSARAGRAIEFCAHPVANSLWSTLLAVGLVELFEVDGIDRECLNADSQCNKPALAKHKCADNTTAMSTQFVATESAVS